MESWHTTDPVHIGGWWLWSKMCRQGTCRTSSKSAQRTIQTNMQLDRKTIHRHYPWLGVQVKTSPPLYAGICQESTKTILPWNETAAAFPVHMCTNKIWGHQTINNNGISSTTTRRTGKTVHSTIMWKVPLPGQSNWQNLIVPNQRTGGTIIQSHWRHNV